MKKFLLLLATILLLSGATCSAEDLRFIDAMDDTGYYYDADSVESESDRVHRENGGHQGEPKPHVRLRCANHARRTHL